MHTEGPWVYAGDSVYGGGRLVAKCASYASTSPVSEYNSPDSVPVGEMDANRCLIAAAPSLLQALSEVVAEWDERNRRYCAEHGPGYYPPEDTGGIMLARAAIAKAEGK